MTELVSVCVRERNCVCSCGTASDLITHSVLACAVHVVGKWNHKCYIYSSRCVWCGSICRAEYVYSMCGGLCEGWPVGEW